MTTLIAAGIVTPSNGSAVIEHVLSTSRSIDVEEINKYILAADMGLFEIGQAKPVPGGTPREIDVTHAVLAEGDDVIRFKEVGAVAALEHAADGRVGYGLGGPDCGPCPDEGGPIVGGPVWGGGTCPDMDRMIDFAADGPIPPPFDVAMF